jgi:hypothetical protein
MKIKEGVDLRGVKPETVVLMLIVDRVFVRLAATESVVTSVMDGEHMKGSKHYEGYAADFRTSHIFQGAIPKVVEEIRKCAGSQYDIVIEKDHIHGEFDAK